LRVLIINGPNVNLIGEREKNIYGAQSYEYFMSECQNYCRENNIDLEIFHSNHEGDLVDRIQRSDFDYLIGNFGAFTHYSYSIRDAILSANKPFIEVHVSNIFSREEWRKNSVLSDIALGVITGFKGYSYILALKYLKEVKGNAIEGN
jgi:3-dehydroquinate dehydratase-2